jgi:hypothetical protein
MQKSRSNKKIWGKEQKGRIERKEKRRRVDEPAVKM